MKALMPFVGLVTSATLASAYGFEGWSGNACNSGTLSEFVPTAVPSRCYPLVNTFALAVIDANPGDELCYYLDSECEFAYQHSIGPGCYDATAAFSVKFTGDC
jgi:hypothetical protein